MRTHHNHESSACFSSTSHRQEERKTSPRCQQQTHSTHVDVDLAIPVGVIAAFDELAELPDGRKHPVRMRGVSATATDVLSDAQTRAALLRVALNDFTGHSSRGSTPASCTLRPCCSNMARAVTRLSRLFHRSGAHTPTFAHKAISGAGLFFFLVSLLGGPYSWGYHFATSF